MSFKTFIRTATALIGGLAFLSGTPVAAAPAVTHDAPVVFENDHVRVTEILAAPGQQMEIDNLRSHIIVSLSKARLEAIAEDGRRRLIDYGPGQILWREGAIPRPARLIAGNAHLFVVELKRTGSSGGHPYAPLETDHSTIVDPDQHHLVFENEHVRIIDGMAPAGAQSRAHSHPPSVLISLAKSRFRVTIEGKTRIFDFEPATVRWSNHFRHQWEILAGEAKVVMVEIKSAHTDPRFRRKSSPTSSSNRE